MEIGIALPLGSLAVAMVAIGISALSSLTRRREHEANLVASRMDSELNRTREDLQRTTEILGDTAQDRDRLFREKVELLRENIELYRENRELNRQLAQARRNDEPGRSTAA